MWGKLEDVMSEEDLNVQLETGRLADLIDIFSRESLAFEEGKDVNILSANRYFEMTEHQHSYFEIECVVDGSAIHNPGKNQIYLKKGDIVLIPPQTSHITQPIDGSTIVDLQIRFSTFEITFKDILSSKFPISSYFKNSLYGKGARECVILDAVYAFRLGGIIFPDSQLCAGNCRFCHQSEGKNSVRTGDCGGMFLYAAVWRYMDTMVYRALLKGVQR